jgi:hypothetical protein
MAPSSRAANDTEHSAKRHGGDRATAIVDRGAAATPRRSKRAAVDRGLQGERQIARRLESLLRTLLETAPKRALHAGGTMRMTVDGSGGSSRRIIAIVSAAVSRAKARAPVSIS